MLKLARLGVFDTIHFGRVVPGFIVQVFSAQDRSVPMSAEQLAAIHPLKGEFSKVMKHRRGTVNIGHEDNDPDSAETAFCILLNDAPHLDGKFTVFGHVERGMDVVEQMVHVPQNGERPVVRLEVKKAEVVDSPEMLDRIGLTPALPLQTIVQANPFDSRTTKEAGNYGGFELAAGIGLIIVTGVGSVLLAKRISAKSMVSVHLITVLIASFFLLMLLIPVAAFSSKLGLGLFLGMIGLFKLMGRFEAPVA
jgi:peptidyl-prolyl cis-trans isomerase B (cyclophilin B)